jgi:uncharacterized NAD(P)/FAD-binding protein YdhS
LASSPPCVAIIGAGFSGSLLALHLLRAGPPDLRISLIERSPGFGRGLAYGTHNPRHLLNVRVGNMSAWPDDPGHLERWLAMRDADGSGHPAFIRRGAYGGYLASMLQDAISGADGAQRLLLEHDEAISLRRSDGRLKLTMAMGRAFEVDAVVLAVGNLAPASPPEAGLDDLPPELYAADPWAPEALDGLAETAPVLLLGSGLTMVDIAIALDAAGHKGPVTALSRRGLAPRRHSGRPPASAAPAPAADAPLSHRLKRFRRRADQIGWHEAIDELRPATQAIWRGAADAERGRFLRHLKPWWDVHRHRMAPAVADWLDQRRQDGRLILNAGRVVGAEPAGEGASIMWRPRGQSHDQTGAFARIINCTGPGADISRATDPLLRDLIRTGAIRADAFGLGLDVHDDGRVRAADGAADAPIYAIGPITRGSFWEITAVPDIRNQVAALAAQLGAALSTVHAAS